MFWSTKLVRYDFDDDFCWVDDTFADDCFEISFFPKILSTTIYIVCKRQFVLKYSYKPEKDR